MHWRCTRLRTTSSGRTKKFRIPSACPESRRDRKKCFLGPTFPQRLEAAIECVAVTARVELVPFPKPTLIERGNRSEDASQDRKAHGLGGIEFFDGLGGETFVSFDRKAVETLKAQGVTARLL
jgi:hypothetical protein